VKPEFPPLLSPGLHKHSLAALKTLTVSNFPLSGRRPRLWGWFNDVINLLRAANISCDLWVNGSFVTQKIDPDDVDFVVVIDAKLMRAVNAAQSGLLSQLGNQQFYESKKCHSYVIFHAPPGDALYAKSQTLEAQWTRDFGKSLRGVLKGIAIVEVRP